MYILQLIYIPMTFFSSKGKFSADASEVFIPDNAMLLPRKCNKTMMDFNVHFPLFYAVFATNPPFINKRLTAWKEKSVKSAISPAILPLRLAPRACAASEKTRTRPMAL